MTKVALIADTHFGARRNNKTLLRNARRFFDEIFFPVIDDREIDTIIHLGDMVDNRNGISFTVLEEVREFFIHPLAERRMKTHFIIGNHDVPYNNTNEINAQGSLFKELYDLNDHDFNLHSSVTDIDVGYGVTVVPWINDLNVKETLDHVSRNDGCRVLMGHLAVNGARMNGGMECDHGLSPDVFRNYDLVVSGHFHNRGIYGNVTYMGNPYHLNWGDYGTERGFCVFDTDSMELEYLNNTVSAFRKISYGDDPCEDEIRGNYVRVVMNGRPRESDFKDYMATVNSLGPARVQVIDETPIFEPMVDDALDPNDTMAVLSSYVEDTVDSDIRTDVIERIRDLYDRTGV